MEVINDDKVWNKSYNIYGDASNVEGSLTNLFGNITGFKGNTSNIHGELKLLEDLGFTDLNTLNLDKDTHLVISYYRSYL